MSSMEQAELCGSEMAPFEVDLEALTAREKVRTSADVQEIFERIYRGSMRSSAERIRTVRYFTAVICPLILSGMSEDFRTQWIL